MDELHHISNRLQCEVDTKSIRFVQRFFPYYGRFMSALEFAGVAFVLTTKWEIAVIARILGIDVRKLEDLCLHVIG